MQRPYYVIDAFATESFTGNAAAVVLDADGMTDEQMQAVAGEFNLSETTFILPATKQPADEASKECESPAMSVRFRWFTPTVEVDMCGHATIAGVFALGESGRLQLPGGADSVSLRIETKSGDLTAFLERIPDTATGRMIWLDLIDPTLTPSPLGLSAIAKVLDLPADAFDESLPPVATQDKDVIVFVRDFQTLNEAKPKFQELGVLLGAHRLRGLSVATTKTLTPSINVQSRFFAPAAGVDEDPVTGSVHGPLCAYLVQQGVVKFKDGIAGLTCTQAKAGGRAGAVCALVQPQGPDRIAVRIGGRAVATMHGTLVV